MKVEVAASRFHADSLASRIHVQKYLNRFFSDIDEVDLRFLDSSNHIRELLKVETRQQNRIDHAEEIRILQSTDNLPLVDNVIVHHVPAVVEIK